MVIFYVERLVTIFKNSWKYLLTFVIAFCVGYYVHQPRVIYENIPVTKEVPVVNTITKTETEFVYVPKEHEEDADVEATIEQPKVSVKVNGQDHKFDLVQGETQKFENGKLVMNQQSQITFDLNVPDRNELLLSAEAEINGDGVTPNVILEKRNGKFHYGAKYDLKENELSGFVKYDAIRLYTE